MNKTLVATFSMLRSVACGSQLKSKRHPIDVLADRIRQSATADGLASFMEALCLQMDVSSGSIEGATVREFLARLRDPDARLVQRWLREHSRLAAMIANLRDDVARLEALDAIDLGSEVESDLSISERNAYDFGIVVECLSPLSHGDDRKSGNATLFRRQDVLFGDGRIESLPYYGGNALRGQLRDLLADHLLDSIGLSKRRDRPVLSQWFFQVLYSGGALEERGAPASKAMGKLLGNGGAIRTEGLRRFRDVLPMLSLLGCAIGNKVLPGRIRVADLRPRCKQWGTGDLDASDLMAWSFLTRREDRECPESDHSGMIANTECLKAGTVLDGGIDIDGHCQDVERSALGRGLLLLSERGRLGAQSRMGLGEVRLRIDNLPDPAIYDTFLSDRKDDILGFLSDLGALLPDDFYAATDGLRNPERA